MKNLILAVLLITAVLLYALGYDLIPSIVFNIWLIVSLFVGIWVYFKEKIFKGD